jgi:hypothetical protein
LLVHNDHVYSLVITCGQHRLTQWIVLEVIFKYKIMKRKAEVMEDYQSNSPRAGNRLNYKVIVNDQINELMWTFFM